MSDERRGPNGADWFHKIAPIAVLVIVVIAGVVLYRELRQHSFEDYRRALVQIHPWRMCACVALMMINYCVLIGYDWIAVKSTGHPLPFRRIAFASFVGFAMSYNFGSLLGGGSVRYRFYSVWGLKPVEIAQLVMILAITFWFGVFGLAGVVFLLRPMDIAPQVDLPIADTKALAWTLIGFAAAYLLVSAVWANLWKKPLRFWGREWRFPGFWMSLAQLSVAALDYFVAAACFWLLFPGHLHIAYSEILGLYLLANVAGVLTHAPGGAGVFEAVMVKMAPTAQQPAFTAACVLFRVLYNWLPLLVAVPLYVLFERRLRRQAIAPPAPGGEASAGSLGSTPVVAGTADPD
ncbi:MAG TPA: lysylphosphatidylglycerol synthase domain-containing protein [Planctomycetaceae bacterium]|nr:lysylphosphatidylglycerol synthase domain-containing protein [Planctomycetaceae bacterium]